VQLKRCASFLFHKSDAQIRRYVEVSDQALEQKMRS
jgi:hypothetical protein